MIKNIIFDLGAVIVDLDVDACIKAFGQLAPSLAQHPFFTIKGQQQFIDDFEVGDITPQQFRDHVKTLVGEVPDAKIDEAWNAMLADIPVKNLDFVQSLRTEYRTAVLSNTNQIHAKRIHEMTQSLLQQPNFEPYFDAVFYSQDIQARKPNRNAYEIVLNRCQFKAHETLFIDDRLENIEGAEQCGIHGLLLKNIDDLASATHKKLTALNQSD